MTKNYSKFVVIKIFCKIIFITVVSLFEFITGIEIRFFNAHPKFKVLQSLKKTTLNQE
jgi:hypothetical protein